MWINHMIEMQGSDYYTKKKQWTSRDELKETGKQEPSHFPLLFSERSSTQFPRLASLAIWLVSNSLPLSKAKLPLSMIFINQHHIYSYHHMNLISQGKT